GIWIASAAAWTRATDADESTELAAGTAVYVAFGTAFGKGNWALLVDTPTVGTSPQNWTQTASSGGGEANTGQNVGQGAGAVFQAKAGLSLLFRTLRAASSRLGIVTSGDEISLDVNEGNLNLANMGGTLPAAKLGTHAATHRHGGTDEIAVAVPAPNAIPKAGADGKLASGWLPAGTGDGGGTGSGTVTSVSATPPLSVATPTTTPALSISEATPAASGVMSAADKTKLDGVAAGATANTGDMARSVYDANFDGIIDIGALPPTMARTNVANTFTLQQLARKAGRDGHFMAESTGTTADDIATYGLRNALHKASLFLANSAHPFGASSGFFTESPEGFIVSDGIAKQFQVWTTGTKQGQANINGMLTVTNPGAAGDDTAAPLLEGFKTTEKRLHIGRNGSYFARDGFSLGAFDLNGVRTPYVNLHADRFDFLKKIWLRAGTELVLFSPDGTKSKTLNVNNAGSLNIPGGISSAGLTVSAASWSENSRALEVVTPGGGVRSYFAGYGNLVINMDNANSGTGWDATCPLSINHNPITALTAPLAKFTVAGVERFSVSAKGATKGSGSEVVVTEPAAIGSIVQGAAAQTANLQEWRNSSGTVLSRVGPNGTFTGPISTPRGTVSETTASIADQTTANFDIAAGKTANLLNVATNVAAEIRLYTTAAARTADAGRAAGTAPTAGSGLLYQGTTEAGKLSIPCTPSALIFNLDATPSTTIYGSAKNLSGLANTVTTTLTTLTIER
ncbi:MAG: hypothetical protein KY445_14635, partial [Armatimonadetes bacterium]|nr:hypothetical protein [Armatimonadota bacterium]